MVAAKVARQAKAKVGTRDSWRCRRDRVRSLLILSGLGVFNLSLCAQAHTKLLTCAHLDPRSSHPHARLIRDIRREPALFASWPADSAGPAIFSVRAQRGNFCRTRHVVATRLSGSGSRPSAPRIGRSGAVRTFAGPTEEDSSLMTRGHKIWYLVSGC